MILGGVHRQSQEGKVEESSIALIKVGVFRVLGFGGNKAPGHPVPQNLEPVFFFSTFIVQGADSVEGANVNILTIIGGGKWQIRSCICSIELAGVFEGIGHF